MKSKWIRMAAAVLAAAAFLTVPCFGVTIGGAAVTGSSVRLRSSASTQDAGNILTEMPQGAFLLVEESLNGWYKVSYNGVRGYVSSAYAQFAETASGTYGYKAKTTGTNVNMRADASTAAAVVKTLAAQGTELTVIGVSGQWLKVTDAAGVTGYIRSDLLAYTGDDAAVPPPPVMAVPTTKGQAIAQLAAKFVGYAYTWGGMSPATGFDCSGLANYVCRENGINLHRVAQDVYSYDGVAVDRSNLQPGDLLFFGYGPYSVTHMGIYVGNGQMVHASTSTTGVIYSDITSGYYSRMLVGAKRVV